jgi:hypothetical protein
MIQRLIFGLISLHIFLTNLKKGPLSINAKKPCKTAVLQGFQ